MGSAIGAGVSLYQYNSQKKALKKAEEKADAAEAEAEAEKENLEKLNPAEAQNVDNDEIVSELNKKKKGVQATMLASKGTSESETSYD